MDIVKGQTDCKAERDLVLQGFREQLQILKKSQFEQENVFKARLYDIIEDFSISNEEKYSLSQPWLNELHELEERHTRIRRSLLIGLYSFWEISLMDIANTHIPSHIEDARNSKKSKNFGASDYLKVIYENELPSLVKLIDNNIREFRNYLVHGALTQKRISLINAIIDTHKEFCIKGVCKDYFIVDYKGLNEFIKMFAIELNNAENKTLKIRNLK